MPFEEFICRRCPKVHSRRPHHVSSSEASFVHAILDHMESITALFSTCKKWAAENPVAAWKLEAEDCHLSIGH